MKKYAILITICIASSSLLAQETTKNGTPIGERFGFSVGYFGDRFTNFGYLLGVENYWATTENFNVIGTVQLSNFFVAQNYTALAILPKVGLRYTANWGLLLESSLGLGYQHRFYNYETYTVDAAGQIVTTGKASQASVNPSIGLGVGYDFRRRSTLPLMYFLRASVHYNYPNKHFIFESSYALETGITYVPKFGKGNKKRKK